MAAARGPFSFSPINASDITNFGAAIASQLDVFSSYFETRIEEVARAAQDQDLSQDMGDQQAAIEQALEIKMEVSLAEIANRIARGEIRTAEIAAVGDICGARHGIFDFSGKGAICAASRTISEAQRGIGATISEAQR